MALGIISAGPEASGSHLSGCLRSPAEYVLDLLGDGSGRSFAFEALLGSTVDTCSALVYEGFEEVHSSFHGRWTSDAARTSNLDIISCLLASDSYLFGVPASPEVGRVLDECSQSLYVLVDVGS